MLCHFFSIISVVQSSHVCSAWVSVLYYPRVCAEAQKSPSFCERNSGGHAPNRSEVTSHVISQCKVEERLAPEEEAVAVPMFVPAVIPFSCPAVPAPWLCELGWPLSLLCLCPCALLLHSPAGRGVLVTPKVGETTVQTAWRSTVCLPESFLERKKNPFRGKSHLPCCFVVLLFWVGARQSGPRSWKVPLYIHLFTVAQMADAVHMHTV